MSARHRWMAGAVRPGGTLMLDAGAAAAVHGGGKSLLARGIVRVDGDFERGVIVKVVAPDGQTLAHGRCNYSAVELRRIKGLKSSEFASVLGSKPFDEVIHRDNLVLIAGA